MGTKYNKRTQKHDETSGEFSRFEAELNSPDTPGACLKQICMTLAHMDSSEAQELLARFKESKRAKEVPWLDMAIDEGGFIHMEPRDEEEEKDYLALKMVQEMNDQLTDLGIELSEARLNLRKSRIEEAAIRELVRANELQDHHESVARNTRIELESSIVALSDHIERKEKVMNRIHQSIRTQKYLELEIEWMRSIQFT